MPQTTGKRKQSTPLQFSHSSLAFAQWSKITSADLGGMTGIEIIAGVGLGLTAYVLVRALMMGFFTVAPNERAVLTSFGRAQRIGRTTTLDTPLADDLPEIDRERYCYPQLHVIGPGGPYFRWPWQKVHKVNVAISTASIAFEIPRGRKPIRAVWCSKRHAGSTEHRLERPDPLQRQ